jgi:hypothetical protein
VRKLVSRRPSASMIVAMIALVIAVSGSAVAASRLVNGDRLIRKRSLSGNRLRNHTITGRQINMSKLGTVPSATAAGDALAVDGQTASAFEPSSHWIRTGLVKAPVGQTVALASFGPFTLSLQCAKHGAGLTYDASILASSTEANSDGYDVQMLTAGTAYTVISPINSAAAVPEIDDNAANLFTPGGKTYIAVITEGAGTYLGLTDTCFANALITPS